MRSRPLNSSELADAIELEMLASARLVRSIDELGRALEVRSVSSRNLPLAIAQMSWRRNVLGAAYPFELSDVAVRLAQDGVEMSPYTAMLLMTPAMDAFSDLELDESVAALVLEKLTCRALEQMLGQGARSVRFGWPSEIGRPQDFSSAIKWLAELMRIRVGAGYRPPRRKDGGVDVIAWRPFNDGRPGFPIILAQCTVERDFVHKARDVDIRQWAAWLSLEASILVVLALPGTLPSDEIWNEIGRNCVILERLRLTSLLAQGGWAPEPSVRAYVEARLRVLRGREEAITPT